MNRSVQCPHPDKCSNRTNEKLRKDSRRATLGEHGVITGGDLGVILNGVIKLIPSIRCGPFGAGIPASSASVGYRSTRSASWRVEVPAWVTPAAAIMI